MSMLADTELDMATQPVTRLTEEEYLRLERVADHKSEFVDGEIFPIAGGQHGPEFFFQKSRGAPATYSRRTLVSERDRVGLTYIPMSPSRSGRQRPMKVSTMFS